MKRLILFLALLAPSCFGQISMSIGPITHYNDQHGGRNGWPNNGRYFDGDSQRSTWCNDNKTYVLFSDGLGPNASLSGGRNIFLGTISDYSTPSGGALFTIVNSLDDYGTITQLNTNGWSDSSSWKTGGLHCQDGVMYMSVWRQTFPVSTGHNGSIVKSLDNGLTWCSPQNTNHTTGACTTTPASNGMAPTSPNNMFEAMDIRDVLFMQYGKDGAPGLRAVERNDEFVYMFGEGATLSDLYPMRIRKTDLPKLDASLYQFHKGGPCTLDSSWGDSTTKAAVTGDINGISNLAYTPMYIAASGYYVFAVLDSSNNNQFYSSRSICGPWAALGSISVDSSIVQAWMYPTVKSLSTVNGVTSVVWGSGAGTQHRDSDPDLNQYAWHFNTFTFTSPSTITNLRQDGATPREAILRYTTTWNGDCTWEVSESPTYSPLINDVNTALFPGSNSDFRNGAQGRERTMIFGAAGLGIKYAPVAADGFRRSRAQQTNTLHYARGTCGSEQITTTVRTANIGVGDTFPDPVYMVDPATPGDFAAPFLPWVYEDGTTIDPQTGVFMQAMRKMNEYFQSTGNPGLIDPTWVYDDSGTWTNKDNIKTLNSSNTTTTANNTIRFYYDVNYDKANATVTDVVANINGFRDATGTTTEICLHIDGATCYGGWVPFTLPVGTAAGVAVGAPTTAKAGMLAPWLSSPSQKVPDIYEVRGKTGWLNLSSGTATLYSQPSISSSTHLSAAPFDPRWTTTTHVIVNGTDYTVSQVNTATEMVLSGSPPDGTRVPWQSANFGFAIRKTSVGGTVTIDSVKLSYQFNGSHQTNGGSGSTIPCTQDRYHEGWRIGGPTGVYTNAATNTAPIVIRTTTNHDFVTGDKVHVYNVPGNTAANGDWFVHYVDANHFSLDGSDGTASGGFPSDASNVVGNDGGGLVYRMAGGTSPEAKMGSLCFMLDGQSNVDWYWMRKEVQPAEVRYLGALWTYPHNGDNAGRTGVGGVDTLNPDYPIATRLYPISGDDQLILGRYIGEQFSGMFRDVGTNVQVGPLSDQWSWTFPTPAPNTVSAKIAAFDARATGQDWGLIGGAGPGKLLFSHKDAGGSQNGLLTMAVWDVIANEAVAYMESWSASNCRWCGVHTLFAFPGTTMVAFVPYNLGGPTNYDGPYRLTPTAALNSTSDVGDCATQLTAIGASNPLNITGSQCSTITLSSMQPISPSFLTPANDTRNNQAIRVGDIMGSTDAATDPALGNDDGERYLILGFNNGTSKIVVMRNYFGGLHSHASDWKLFMLCIPIPRWWDWQNAPHGETGNDPYSQGIDGIFSDPPFTEQSHYFVFGSLSLDDSGGTGILASFPDYRCPDDAGGAAPYAFRNWPWPQHLKAPLSAYGCTKGNPGFDKVAGIGSGEDAEKHPSPVVDQVYNKSFLDARPAGLLNVQKAQGITKVGTYIYKAAATTWACGISNCYGFDEKRNTALVTVGHHPALDVSAAGFILPDTSAYWYTYCMVHVAGECRASSSVGDVYINAPRAAKIPAGYAFNVSEDYSGMYRCAPKGEPWSDLIIDDICLTSQGVYSESIIQYASTHDPFNWGARKLSAGLQLPRTSNNLWNTPPNPDASWLVNWGGIVNNSRYVSMLIKLPPYPGPQPGTNRGSWIPIPIKLTSVPVGTATVSVEFGYNPSRWCTSRNEACVAVDSTITSAPFYWVSDTYTRLACASGCTPVIPALSQRMLWTRIKYWNSGGAVIKTVDQAPMTTP